jgi:glucose dehydrogenase
MKRLLSLALLTCTPLIAQSNDDWPMFGHDSGSTRYSELKQINPANVGSLTRAWTVHLKSVASVSSSTTATGSPRFSRISEATPIVVDGVMYLPTPYGTVIALDADTGKELWTYKLTKGQPSSRGVAYWAGDKQTSASIIFGTNDGHLVSLNARTGKPTPGFGTDGAVDMKRNLGEEKFPEARLILNSPVSIYKGILITGSQVQESPTGLAGDIRGWDAHTGALLWQFHTIPHDGEAGRETWPADRSPYRTGANVWGQHRRPQREDRKAGLVFSDGSSRHQRL